MNVPRGADTVFDPATSTISPEAATICLLALKDPLCSGIDCLRGCACALNGLPKERHGSPELFGTRQR